MAKPSITKRSVKAAALTYAELDTNFQNLADATVSLTAGTGGTQVTIDLNGNITLVAGTGISLSGDNTAKTLTITNTSAQNLFSTIAVAGQSNVVADSSSDTLTLVAGSNITLTTDATNDSVTISSSGGTDISSLLTIADAGSFTNIKSKSSDDLRLSADPGSGYIQLNYGGTVSIVSTGTGFTQSGRFRLGQSYSGSNSSSLISPNIDITASTKLSISSPSITGITTTARDAIVSPSDGTIIYNTTDSKFQGRAAGAWVDLH
jgi:hypothetical protein